MDILDNYSKRLNNKGTNNKDRLRYRKNAVLNKSFKNLNEYEQVKIGVDDDESNILYDSWIYETDSYKQEVAEKKIFFPPEANREIFYAGQFIRPQIQGGTYLMTSFSKHYNDNMKGMIKYCNIDLNWIDKKGKYHTIPATVKNGIGEKDFNKSKELSLINGTVSIMTQKKNETLTIDYNDRFIIGDKQVWKVTAFEDYINQVLTLTCVFDEQHDEDDLINKIAYNDINFEITIPQGTDISGLVNENLQLTAIVKGNDDVIENPDIEWSVSDSDIATVDTSGLVNFVSNGQTTVTATLNPQVSINISVSVEETIEETIDFRLDRQDIYVSNKESKTFVVNRYINNVIDNDAVLTIIDISNDSGYDFTTDNNRFTVNNNNKFSGEITIRISDGTNSKDFNIGFRPW